MSYRLMQLSCWQGKHLSTPYFIHLVDLLDPLATSLDIVVIPFFLGIAVFDFQVLAYL
ncbi:hypothetical protein QBC39DRAFT_374569 [Podospora conica]|nr:hypothetical protein QBC39DRAFT_374569 [Schizothecium conicum]